MGRISLALPLGVDPQSRERSLAHAHASYLQHHDVRGAVRPLVLDSWRRCSSFRMDPDAVDVPVPLVDDDLAEAREAHPLQRAMPLIRKLLVDDVDDAGVIVLVGDRDGHVLWLDGDHAVRRRTERLNVTPGARWRESDAGTNAIGTAITLGQTVQVFAGEHYNRKLHSLSCTAAPIHGPAGDVIGFFDISGGGPAMATPQAAFLVRSAVAAVEAELRLLERRRGHRRTAVARLSVLGRDRGVLELDGHAVELSLRHTELLLLLAAHPEGVSAGELAWSLYEHDAAEVTVRAEMSRLRKALPTLVSPSRPYRITGELRTDSAAVADALARGRLDQAVESYRGALLPRSQAPGVVHLRDHLRGWLRRSLLDRAAGDTLLRYAHSPEGRNDVEIWRTALDRLTPASPHRAEARSVLAQLDRDLGLPTVHQAASFG